jgi:hypothetical protein
MTRKPSPHRVVGIPDAAGRFDPPVTLAPDKTYALDTSTGALVEIAGDPRQHAEPLHSPPFNVSRPVKIDLIGTLPKRKL